MGDDSPPFTTGPCSKVEDDLPTYLMATYVVKESEDDFSRLTDSDLPKTSEKTQNGLNQGIHQMTHGYRVSSELVEEKRLMIPINH